MSTIKNTKSTSAQYQSTTFQSAGGGWFRSNKDGAPERFLSLRQPTNSKEGGTLEALSDYQLVERVKEGQGEAFGVIVRRYQKPLQILSMRYVHDAHLAEDIVQESFMKAYEKIASFQFRSAFKSWLYRIVINTSKNSLRSSKPTVDIEKVQLKIDAVCEMTLIEKQLLQQAKEVIASLPVKQQKAVNLRVFSDLSFKEVAHEMTCPYDTAKANYRHGLVKIKEKLVPLIWNENKRIADSLEQNNDDLDIKKFNQ